MKTKRILIRVQQHVIDAGIKANCRSCPIALAIANTFNCKVFVGSQDADFYNPDWKLIQLPRSAQRFIHAFDSGKLVKPFNFYLAVPS